MKSEQLVERELKVAETVLGQSGFALSGASIFHRCTAWGWHGIQLPFIVGESGRATTVFVASVRFDQVERIVVRNSGVGYSDGPTRSTFAVFGQDTYAVTPAAPGSQMGDWIIVMMEKYAGPLFARYNSIDIALADLQALPAFNERFDFPMDHERAKRVLACLVALGRRDELHQAIEEQREWVTKQPSGIVAEFDLFVTNLRKELRDGAHARGT